MEDDLFVVLGHVLDINHPGSKGLYERAKRAIDPQAAKNDGDRQARTARRGRFLRSTMVGDAIPDDGVYPGLGDRWNQPPSERIALPFPKVGITRITEKIVRGITYIEGNGAYVELPLVVDVFVVEEKGAAPTRRMIERFGMEYARGPGISVKRAIAEDGQSALFEIEFFQQFKSYASISPYE